MATARVNGIDVWYERTTPGDGTPLVLTHGFAGPSSSGWPPVIHEFRRRFDLVLYDCRAHGNTTVPDASTVTMPQFAADLAGLMDALGIDKAHVAGVSMGGMVSAQFACDFTDRLLSLWLCDTTAGNGQGPDEAANEAERRMASGIAMIADIAEKYGVEEVVRRENRYRRETDPYSRLSPMSLDEQDEKNRMQKCDHMTREGYLASVHALASRPDLTSHTPSITAPTLVSCGEWDLFYPCAVRDARLIPNARLVTVERAAHATPDFAPEVWWRTGVEFLESVNS
jgi:pimeloyl-ACP methyl ester carboxylesterase